MKKKKSLSKRDQVMERNDDSENLDEVFQDESMYSEDHSSYNESIDDNEDPNELVEQEIISSEYESDENVVTNNMVGFSKKLQQLLESPLSTTEHDRPILSKAKSIERKLEEDKLDEKCKRIIARKRSKLLEKGRVKPTPETLDYERQLRKVATHGGIYYIDGIHESVGHSMIMFSIFVVISLFNTITQQQKMLDHQKDDDHTPMPKRKKLEG
jgi:hypothetical protein